MVRTVYHIHGPRGNVINFCCFIYVTQQWTLHAVIKRQFLLGRPTYVSADLSFTAILFLSFIFFFFRPLPSELAQRNSTKIGHMLGSRCDLKIRVRNVGYNLSLQIGGRSHFFRWFRNLTATLTAYIFEMIDNRASALATTRGLLATPSRSNMNFGLQTA